MSHRLCILICENLKDEAIAIVESQGFDEVRVVTFAADCIRPQSGWSSLAEVVRANERECSEIHLWGGNCLAGTEELVKELKCCYLHKSDTCFDLLVGRNQVERHLRKGDCLLTPGWLARWRDYVDRWGEDQTVVRDFKSATRLVLLDTGVDAQSARHLEEFADFAARPFAVTPVGLDFFRLALSETVLKWRLENRERQAARALADANRRVADHTMVLDLVASLTGVMIEADVIDGIFELFAMLCAPANLLYIPFVDGKPQNIQSRPASLDVGEVQLHRLVSFGKDYAWTDSGSGFLLRIAHGGETVGILEIDGIAFPEYKEHYLNLALNLVRVCGLAISNARTYQEIRRVEERIRASLQEKTVLLQEIHHRVKNNLQIISSLLDMQSLIVQDPATLQILQDSQARIRIMALVHEQLYQSPDLASLNVADYVQGLVGYLRGVHGSQLPGVTLNVRIDDVSLDLDTAIPCGLIINELVSNALKYAFPGKGYEEGKIDVELCSLDDDRITLVVRDNGVGLPPTVDLKTCSSLGLRLVRMLTRQLRGVIKVERDAGTAFKITFAGARHRPAGRYSRDQGARADR